MINFVLSIIGGVLLLIAEMFVISANLISIGAIAAIELYQRIKWWEFLIIFMIISLGVDSYFNYFLGTYFISVVLLVLVHSSGKRLLPYDRTPIRLLVLIISFMVFHLSRNLLISIQLNSLVNFDVATVLLSSFVKSIIETAMVVGISYLLNTYFGRNITSVKVNI